MSLQYGEYCIYGDILGQDWYKSKINQNIELYQRSSCDNILDLLKVNRRELVAESMKKKLKLFNQHFNEICKAQSEWFIFDDQLRERMIKSIENTLLPAYGTFIGMIRDVVGKDAYEFIRYGMHNDYKLVFMFTLLLYHTYLS